MRIDLQSARSLALGCALLAGMPGITAAQEPPNGDFEAGVLEPWFGSGDIGVSQDNVLEGAWSGFLTTGPNAVGEVCSYLHSPEVFPPTDQGRVKVTFKVRYKTNEGTGPFAFFEDPFHAEFVTVRGALDLLTIKTDGIFWTKGNPTGTSVIDEATGTKLQGPPQIPPFGPGVLFGSETPTLSASSEIKLKGCEPVRIKFEICDWVDQVVDSAAYVDAVNISFKEDGKKCPDNQQGLFGIEGGQGIPVRQ